VVEHSLGKGEVAGPIPAMGTIYGGGLEIEKRASFNLMWFKQGQFNN
jgi:hypothetical protein